MEDPLCVRVTGRSGAGLRTVARALRGAGIAVTDDDGLNDGRDDGQDYGQDVAVDVYVFVETLNADDRAALAAAVRPTVAVLNKADLAGFGDGGPPASLAERCRQLRRATGVPVRPLSGLLAVAGTVSPVLESVYAALRSLASGGALSDDARGRLTAELDVFGTAVAVAALREGADRPAVAERLWRFSGIGEVLTDIVGAAAPVRYRRATGAARIAAARAVLDAAGAPAPPAAGYLRQAVHWQRYSRGPVSSLHRACALDAARGAMRRWTQAGGQPVALL